MIVVDLPPEEDEELRLPALRAGLSFIRLATPTTDDARLPAVLANTSGFVYYVSITGVTGAGQAGYRKVAAAVARIKGHTSLPVAVGFGVKNAAAAGEIAAHRRCASWSARPSSTRWRARSTRKVAAARRRSARSRGLVGELARGVASAAQEAVEKGEPMNWISNVVPPKIRSIMRRRDAGKPLGQMPGQRRDGLPQGSGGQSLRRARAPAITCASRPRRGSTACSTTAPIETLPTPEVPADPLKFRDVKRYADRLKDYRAKTGRLRCDPAGARRLAGHAGDGRGAGFRFPGRLARHGGGRGHRHRHVPRDRAEDALHHFHRLRRRAHAGRHALADADAAHHRRGRSASRRRNCPISWC